VQSGGGTLALQAIDAYNAGMSNIQYTIRGIPERLDAQLRNRAAEDGKSLNETVIGIMKAGAGISDVAVRNPDLDDLAGTWVGDPEFDKAILEMDQVDPELWK
jgi:plasmid stability protein